jgi:hypothetical protein
MMTSVSSYAWNKITLLVSETRNLQTSVEVYKLEHFSKNIILLADIVAKSNILQTRCGIVVG